MVLELRKADQKDRDLWETLLESSRQSTIFHSWDWLKIAERYSDSAFHPMIVYNGSEPIGLIPLFFQKRSFQKMVFSPPPHLAIPYLGPVFANYDQLKQHKKETFFIDTQKALDLYIADELHADYVSIFLPPNLQDPRPFSWTGYGLRPVYDYVIDLRGSLDQIRANFGKNLRMAISQGEKRGFVAETGNSDAWRTLYSLMVSRYEQQNKSVRVPIEYLEAVQKTFPDTIKTIVVKYEGEIVTGCIDILYRDELLSWIGNLRPLKKLSPSPNDLCCYYEIAYAKQKALNYYITAEAAGNPRLHEYYSKFNPDLRIRFSVKKASFLAQTCESAYVQVIKPVFDRFHL